MSDDVPSQTLEYKNKFTFTQRGGSLEINNSTEREDVKISQYSGSNITLNNFVNSELAVNNKQVKVNYDDFKTVGNNLSEYTGGDRTNRVGENQYDIKGVGDMSQLEQFDKWKEVMRPIALLNSQFSIFRGGASIPNGTTTPLSGTRSFNPDLGLYRNTNQIANVVNNYFTGYGYIPVVDYYQDGVSDYKPVTGRIGTQAELHIPTEDDVFQAFGFNQTGTEAPGIGAFGVRDSSSTENGSWDINFKKIQLSNALTDIQRDLNSIEESMGNGGDEIEFVKRHKVVNIGATYNDFPAIRIDPRGKSMPSEIGISNKGIQTHYEGTPLVEEVDNSSNFPCGNYSLNVGNRYILHVGSGGVEIKTPGSLTLNGGISKISGTKLHLVASQGMSIQGEKNIDISSQSIQLRSNRQILMQSALGVDKNTTVKGGLYVEGETMINHVTAPIEVQETYQTSVYGEIQDNVIIGIAKVAVDLQTGIGEGYVYGLPGPNQIKVYDHSHHFPNLPLTLTESNESLRNFAINEKQFNKANSRADASPIIHEFKGDLIKPDFEKKN